MKAGTHNHLKTKRLQRLLEIPLYRAVGVLETIWLLCVDCCDEGNIGKFTDAEIAEYLEWEGDPSKLVNALAESGWLDPDEDYRFRVHDWFEHCPDFIKNRIRKRNARAVKANKTGDNSRDLTTYDQSDADNCGQERTCPPPSGSVPSMSIPFQPIQAKSILITPKAPASVPVSHIADTDPPADDGDDDDGFHGDFSQGWAAAKSKLSELGASRWRETIEDAKSNGCTPGHVMELLAFAKAHRYPAGSVVYRISRARMTLPVSEGWPPKPPDPESGVRKRADAIGQQLRETQATKIIKAGRKASKSDDAIKSELAAAGLEWPK